MAITEPQREVINWAVERFLDLRRETTSLEQVLRKYRNEEASRILSDYRFFQSIQGGYAPKPLAFESCGNETFLMQARRATKVALQILQNLEETHPEKQGAFKFLEFVNHAAKMFDLTPDHSVLTLGFFLAWDFDVFYQITQTDGRLEDSGDQTSFILATTKIIMIDPTHAWDKHIASIRSGPVPAGNINSQRSISKLPNPNLAVREDYRFAKLAINQARKSVAERDGRPHPQVGAVVVKNGEVLSAAHRGEEPGSHAEFIVLEKKLPDSVIAGATVYTTLEPCTTRTHPKIPCAERLVERKVARVVIGMLDPDPRITGRGQLRLREANIVTEFFPHDLMTEVEELNREFTRYCRQQSRSEKTERLKADRLSERVISESARLKIIETLKPFASRLVDIVKSPEDAEVYELSRQIFDVLMDSGWKPTTLAAPPSGRVSGIVVEVDPKNPPNLAAGNALVSALSEAGLVIEGPKASLHTPPVGASVRITVGRK